MSMVPPPPAAPTWPSYPLPEPRQNQRRWPAITASLGASAAVAGIITTAVTLAVTPEPAVTVAASAAPQIVTVTAAPSTPPAPLSTVEADKQTCHAWGTTDTLYNAAVVAQSVIPKGMTVLDPAVQGNPAWKAGVMRASQLYGQAADNFAAQIAPGTSLMLAQVADTTVSSLRTLSEAYKTFDPVTGSAVEVYQAERRALDRLCR